MKYFDNIYFHENTQESEKERVWSDYVRFLEKNIERFPETVQILLQEFGPFEGIVSSVTVDDELTDMVLEVKVPNPHEKYGSLCTFHYTSVVVSRIDLSELLRGIKKKESYLVAQEFDLDTKSGFIHRLRLKNGSEIDIGCQDLDLTMLPDEGEPEGKINII
jgi:hypothetical protein